MKKLIAVIIALLALVQVAQAAEPAACADMRIPDHRDRGFRSIVTDFWGFPESSVTIRNPRS